MRAEQPADNRAPPGRGTSSRIRFDISIPSRAVNSPACSRSPRSQGGRRLATTALSGSAAGSTTAAPSSAAGSRPPAAPSSVADSRPRWRPGRWRIRGHRGVQAARGLAAHRGLQIGWRIRDHGGVRSAAGSSPPRSPGRRRARRHRGLHVGGGFAATAASSRRRARGHRGLQVGRRARRRHGLQLLAADLVLLQLAPWRRSIWCSPRPPPA